MSVFSPIQHNSTASEVEHQLESLILEGVLRVGDQLPGERDLAEQTGVSRPIVRQAIKSLEDKGILTRRHGGGTFVANIIGTVFSPQIANLLPHHEKATLDYLEYRREIEGIAAGMAADRATSDDLALLADLVDKMRKAHADPDFETEARLDVEFHSLIGEMAHNLILLHTLRSCYEMLAGGVFENRSRLYSRPGARQAIFDQHIAIAEAISASDQTSATTASRNHLNFIIDETLKQQQSRERERVSALRLMQRS